MFAVIVLGIGFIMIAAMFPVMISQSKITIDETTAAAIARGALAQTARIAEGGDNPAALVPQLLPPTDLYFTQLNGGAATQGAVADCTKVVGGNPNAFQFTIEAGQQVSIPGKVLSFNDARLDNSTAPGPLNYRANLWNAIKGNLILPSDSRYAWVPLYRRDRTYYNSNVTGSAGIAFPAGVLPGAGVVTIDAPFATVYFIPVAVRNRSLYDTRVGSFDIDASALPAGPQVANLEPRPVRLQVLPSDLSLTGYMIVIGNNPPVATTGTDNTQISKGNTIESVSEGTFVIVSDDRIIGPVQPPGTGRNVNQGRMNGRIFRLGTRRIDLDGSAGILAGGRVYEAAPGYTFSPEPGANNRFYNLTTNPTDNDDVYGIGNTEVIANYKGNNTNSTVLCDRAADAFVIGRGTTSAAGGFDDAPQDVAAYVTFVRVN